MAKVKTFLLDDSRWAVPDVKIAEFITACEEEFYVNVSMTYVPFPDPRVVVVVTKLDVK